MAPPQPPGHARRLHSQRGIRKLVADFGALENQERLPEVETGSIVDAVAARDEQGTADRFYKTHPEPTREQVLTHATELDRQFGSRFLPGG